MPFEKKNIIEPILISNILDFIFNSIKCDNSNINFFIEKLIFVHIVLDQDNNNIIQSEIYNNIIKFLIDFIGNNKVDSNNYSYLSILIENLPEFTKTGIFSSKLF